jgi:hypothetical protein
MVANERPELSGDYRERRRQEGDALQWTRSLSPARRRKPVASIVEVEDRAATFAQASSALKSPKIDATRLSSSVTLQAMHTDDHGNRVETVRALCHCAAVPGRKVEKEIAVGAYLVLLHVPVCDDGQKGVGGVFVQGPAIAWRRCARRASAALVSTNGSAVHRRAA